MYRSPLPATKDEAAAPDRAVKRSTAYHGLMQWLNYHHLLYFYAAAKEGSISKASKTLAISHPTISTQIRQLERRLGERLFERVGRRLELTDIGRIVYNYAQEIFGLGDEMVDAVKGRPTGRPLRVVVGVADVIPKLLAYRLIHSAISSVGDVHLVCREAPPDDLFGRLASHSLDVVLTDTPLVGHDRVRSFNHLLTEYNIAFFAGTKVAPAMKKKFPKSLDGAPMLLPTTDSTLRRALDQWFDAKNIEPKIVAEFEDSALLKVFGQVGFGAFAAPAIIANEICEQYDVRVIGEAGEIRERIYAVTIERRIVHPVVSALAESARALDRAGK